MNDGRFYSLLMVLLLIGIILLLLLFNWLQQPEGLDRTLWTMILTAIGPTAAVLLNNMSNNKQAKSLHEGQEQIKQQVASAEHKAAIAAKNAEHAAETASELVRQKGKP